MFIDQSTMYKQKSSPYKRVHLFLNTHQRYFFQVKRNVYESCEPLLVCPERVFEEVIENIITILERASCDQLE